MINPIDEIEEAVLTRFFSNADFENEVINAIFNCIRRKDYIQVLKKYTLEQITDICCVDYQANINDKAIFEGLTAIPSYDFI